MSNYPYFIDQPMYNGMINAVNPQQFVQQQPQQYQMKQILDPAEQNLLKEKGASRDGFYTPITKVEEAASRCTHKYNNGTIALGDPDENGYRTCAICKTKFHCYDVDEISAKQVAEKCEEVRNIMETIKLYKGDIETDIGRTIYPFTTILVQVPNMWKNATEYIKKYVGIPVNGATIYGGTAITPAQLYNMMYQGGVQMFGQQGAYTQPVMGGQYAMGYYQQPVQPVVQPNQPGVMPQVPVQGAAPAQPQVQGVPAQPVMQGYVPYGNVTPSIAVQPGIPAANMQNPIAGNYVQVQATPAVTPSAPPATPAQAPAADNKMQFEN